MLEISIAKDYTKTPGFRYESQSEGSSGEAFRDKILEPKYLEARSLGEQLRVNLDGTNGFLTSFLEEAFGGLQRKVGKENILNVIKVISSEEPYWIDEIENYVKDVLEME
jgi:hypothetical protein